MPAVFVAEEMGPVEPNVYRAFAKGRPNFESDNVLPNGVEHFLLSTWDRFGRNTPDSLSRICQESMAFKQALMKGNRTEIPLKDMLLSFAREKQIPLPSVVEKPKMMRSQTGRSVKVKNWVPGS